MMQSSQVSSKSTTLLTRQVDSTQLIYAGGTFGCHGKPLNPIKAEAFLPELQQHLAKQNLDNIAWLPNPLIKDSSQLTPADLVHFYQLIFSAYAGGKRRFILITGTDTLSYLGSFLAEAFAGSDISVVLTGSMRPLFNADYIDEYVIDPQSDAWNNLIEAIGLASHGEPGVRVCFAGESWPAQTVQKLHSHDFMAFTGHRRAAYPANSYDKRLPEARRRHWVDDQLAMQQDIIRRSESISIYPLYCMPNNSEVLELQLSDIIKRPASGIILMGFGAGNVPYSSKVAQLLDSAYQQGHMVISASQCAFGGVGDDYAAGSWQYDHHVISGGRLTLPAIYARLLWLHLRFDTPARRRQRWSNTVKQTNPVRS